MFVNTSNVRCGGRSPCIAYSQNLALKPTSSRRRFEDFNPLIVESGMCLMPEDVNRAGCGGGLPRIAHSRNWALESVISPTEHPIYARWICSPRQQVRTWCRRREWAREWARGSLQFQWRNERPSASFQRPPAFGCAHWSSSTGLPTRT